MGRSWKRRAPLWEKAMEIEICIVYLLFALTDKQKPDAKQQQVT